MVEEMEFWLAYYWVALLVHEMAVETVLKMVEQMVFQ